MTDARPLARWAGAHFQALGLSVLLVTFAAAVFWFVAFFVPGQRQAAIDSWRRDLDVRAEIRKEALQRYFVDGLADAETLAAYPTALQILATRSAGAAGLVADTGVPAAHLEELFGAFVRIHGVLGVVLWDADGKPRVKSSDLVLDAACMAPAREVLASGAPATGFHLHEAFGPILTFSAPVRSATGDIRGAVVIAVDPRAWLYPLLAQPLAGTSTGEAFLVGRDGADILFLSPLRNRPGAPLSLRRRLDESGLPARAALEGSEIVGPLVDYRGVRVLYAGRRLPPSPWALVVKVDEKEALADFRAGALRTALAWGSLAVAFLGIAWGVWQMRGRRQAVALVESERRFRSLFEGMLDGYAYCEMLYEGGRPHDFVYLEVNSAFERLTGLKGVVGKRVSDVIPGIRESSPELLETYGRVVATGTPERFEIYLDVLGIWFSISAYSPKKGHFVAVFDNVTERKRAEEALRLSEERFRIAAETANDVVYEWDLKQSVQWVGKIDEMLAYEPGKFPRTLDGWAALVHPEDLASTMAAIQAHLEGRAPYASQYRVRRADGVYRWWSARGAAARAPDGTPLRWIGSITDITEGKQADEALRESESRFRQLAESLPQLVWTCQPDGPCDYFNRQWIEFTGVPEAQQLGFGWLEQLHPDDRAPTIVAWEAAVASGANFSVEFRIRRHDGEYRWFDTRAVRLLDAEGHTTKWYGSNTDITERKTAETVLRESEARYRTLLENIPQQIFMKSRTFRYVSVNENYARDLGIRPEEAVGKVDYDLFPRELADKYRADDERVMETAQPEAFEEQYVQGGREKWIHTIKTPVKDRDGEIIGILGVFWDITERKRADEALRESEMKLRELTEELESRVETRTVELKAANRELEAFSYSVSHDLRAPLRAVDGFSRILLEDHAKQLDAEGRRLLDVVRSNTRQMGQLIDDLLSFSRIGRQEMARTAVDMKALAHAAFSDLLAADERVSFTVGELPHADVDPSLMRQVWTNLISNSLKFTRPKAERVIEVGARTEPGRIAYWVKDNGVGFDMAYAHKLFGVFQRLHSSHEFEGTGVGLALVQRIVHRHGGEVWADGKVGEGATFSFSLPRPGGPP